MYQLFVILNFKESFFKDAGYIILQRPLLIFTNAGLSKYSYYQIFFLYPSHTDNFFYVYVIIFHTQVIFLSTLSRTFLLNPLTLCLVKIDKRYTI